MRKVSLRASFVHVRARLRLPSRVEAEYCRSFHRLNVLKREVYGRGDTCSKSLEPCHPTSPRCSRRWDARCRFDVAIDAVVDILIAALMADSRGRRLPCRSYVPAQRCVRRSRGAGLRSSSARSLFFHRCSFRLRAHHKVPLIARALCGCCRGLRRARPAREALPADLSRGAASGERECRLLPPPALRPPRPSCRTLSEPPLVLPHESCLLSMPVELTLRSVRRAHGLVSTSAGASGGLTRLRGEALACARDATGLLPSALRCARLRSAIARPGDTLDCGQDQRALHESTSRYVAGHALHGLFAFSTRGARIRREGEIASDHAFHGTISTPRAASSADLALPHPSTQPSPPRRHRSASPAARLRFAERADTSGELRRLVAAPRPDRLALPERVAPPAPARD